MHLKHHKILHTSSNGVHIQHFWRPVASRWPSSPLLFQMAWLTWLSQELPLSRRSIGGAKDTHWKGPLAEVRQSSWRLLVSRLSPASTLSAKLGTAWILGSCSWSTRTKLAFLLESMKDKIHQNSVPVKHALGDAWRSWGTWWNLYYLHVETQWWSGSLTFAMKGLWPFPSLADLPGPQA